MNTQESPKEYYDSSGSALIMIGSGLMCVALIVMVVDHVDAEYNSKHDHFSNLLIALSIILTGLWLKSHDDEDLSS